MRIKNLRFILIIGLFSFLEYSHNIVVFGHGIGG